jgi:hypothetical protein
MGVVVVVSTLTAMPLKTGSPKDAIWHLVRVARLTRKMRPAVCDAAPFRAC